MPLVIANLTIITIEIAAMQTGRQEPSSLHSFLQKRRFCEGRWPLVLDALPEMPWIRGTVPSETKPVISAGTNPVGPTSAFEKGPWKGKATM